jgi:hypothetical protein
MATHTATPSGPIHAIHRLFFFEKIATKARVKGEQVKTNQKTFFEFQQRVVVLAHSSRCVDVYW